MKKYKILEIFLLLVVLLIILLFLPLSDLKKAIDKRVYKYNKEITLNEDVCVYAHVVSGGDSKTEFYTYKAGTVLISELLNENGDILNASYTSNSGERISSYDIIPADKFMEKNLIFQDLHLYKIEKEKQIQDAIRKIFIFSCLALILSLVFLILLCRLDLTKNKHLVLVFTLIGFISIGILLLLARLFLTK